LSGLNRTHEELISSAKAGFEAGIKLGALFHQFVGMPVSEKNVDAVEKTIESCVSLQPFVKSVRVEIDRELLRKRKSGYGYTSLYPEMLKAEVTVVCGKFRAVARLEWKGDYPLMELVSIDAVRSD